MQEQTRKQADAEREKTQHEVWLVKLDAIEESYERGDITRNEYYDLIIDLGAGYK